MAIEKDISSVEEHLRDLHARFQQALRGEYKAPEEKASWGPGN